MLSDSISEGAIFKIFWGGMPPDPPSIGMLRMHVCFAHKVNFTFNGTTLQVINLLVQIQYGSLHLPYQTFIHCYAYALLCVP